MRASAVGLGHLLLAVESAVCLAAWLGVTVGLKAWFSNGPSTVHTTPSSPPPAVSLGCFPGREKVSRDVPVKAGRGIQGNRSSPPPPPVLRCCSWSGAVAVACVVVAVLVGVVLDCSDGGVGVVGRGDKGSLGSCSAHCQCIDTGGDVLAESFGVNTRGSDPSTGSSSSRKHNSSRSCSYVSQSSSCAGCTGELPLKEQPLSPEHTAASAYGRPLYPPPPQPLVPSLLCMLRALGGAMAPLATNTLLAGLPHTFTMVRVRVGGAECACECECKYPFIISLYDVLYNVLL